MYRLQGFRRTRRENERRHTHARTHARHNHYYCPLRLVSIIGREDSLYFSCIKMSYDLLLSRFDGWVCSFTCFGILKVDLGN